MKRNSYKVFAFSVILSLLLTTLPVPQHVLAVAPAVIINEVDSDTLSTDVLEFVELYDGGVGNTALDGLVVVFYNGSNDLSYAAYDLDGFSTDANGYFLLGNKDITPTPGIIFDSNGLQNGADAVALYSDDAATFPPNTLVTTVNLLDAIVYDTSDADDAGLLVLLNAGQPQVDENGGSDGTGQSNQRCPNGSGGALNTDTYTQFAPTPGSANCVPVSTNPSGTGLADPASVDPAGSSLLTVAVTPGANLTSTGLTVSCDLTSIGGSASQSFFDDGSNGDVSSGDNTFSYLATVNIGTSPGAKSLPCTINDLELRTGSANVGLTVNSLVDLPDIIINEVDSDTPGTDAAEFVELYDGGVGNTALDGLVVVFYNGSNDLSYASYDLDGFSTDSNGYFLLGNAGVSPTPGITFAGNFLQNGADAVALFTDDASNFPNGTAVTTTNLLDAIVYDTSDADDAGLLVLLNAGQPQVNENGRSDSAYRSSQRCPNGSGGALNTDTYAQFAPTPGDANICVTKIHEVQGNGSASPLAGQTVAIEGIVVGDFQDGASGTNGDFNGFHIQEEDADADADPLTSEGIFVYDGSSPAVDVHIGDLVHVEGAVSEYNGLTEITSYTGVTVVSSGNALPAATSLSLPVTSVDDFEAFEGMYVTFPQPLVISEYFNYDRFGELVLTSVRHLTPSAEFEPGPDAVQAAADFLLDKITLDDGRSTQNPNPAIHPNGSVFDLDNLFRGGDTVANVTGIMDYSFSLYRIQPTQGADYTAANPRTEAPEDVDGSLKVVSMNTLNFFSTIDKGKNYWICGPAQDMECRGADTPEELNRQRDKLVAAITIMNADVIGLLEIENNKDDEAVIDLVDSLNAVLGADTYDYIHTGTIGGDAIKVALIYKPATVSLVGGYAILDSSVDPRFIDTRNRPALAQSFMDNSTGGIFTVAVNHLKSKGSACDGDPDLGDGAGNCNVTRTLAAEALVDWLATDPTGSSDADFLIIGDLNSYDKEDPIDAILAGPDDILGTDDDYTDLAFEIQGEDAYSYVFDGQIGYLDYGLASANLLDQVTGITDWHVNADEPDLIDYDMSFKLPAQDALYAPDAYRYSDHDPVIIGLNLNDDLAPTFETLSVTPKLLWPANHKYVDVSATVVGKDNLDLNPIVTLVSVTSNEPDNGDDDGNTINDIVILDDFTFQLRAERSGIGTGRIYTITYMVEDESGNSTTEFVTVSVPLSMKKR